MEIVRRWQEDGIPEKLYPLTRQTLWTEHPVSLLRWLKAGLYDREGREAGVQRLPLCALSPQPGWAERDMAELWQCCMAVIRALLTHSGVSGEQIVGIGISAQGKGLFLLDKNNKPLGNAILP